MRPLTLIVAVAFAAVAHGQTARPAAVAPDDGVRVVAAVQYYDVAGRSEADLFAAMRAQGPKEDGQPYFGLTYSELRYAYSYATGPGCRPSALVVTTTVTTTLPRWTPPRGTPYALERDWRYFERALRAHEDGHRRFAEEEAATLRRLLGALRAPTCEALDAEARRQAEALRARYVTQHQAYDRSTQHGRTQGAVWPRE